MSSVASCSTTSNAYDWKGFKIMKGPRIGKSLVVFDLDQTIYDRQAYFHGFDSWTPRPYLHELLGNVYERCDIALWSATKMPTLRTKVARLKLNGHSNYKIAFYVDTSVMVPVKFRQQDKTIWVKPLAAIWNRFPQYNESNTIMCDNNVNNFHLNPKNGILVSPYYYGARSCDQELLHLDKYLQHFIHSSDDYSAVNHVDWRNHPSVAT